VEITEDELIAALEEALNPEGYLTTTGICKKMKWGRKRTLRLLHLLHSEERLDRTFIFEEDIAGRLGPVPAYRVIK
jgi:hypothetical protein